MSGPIASRCANTKVEMRAICHFCKQDMGLVHLEDFRKLQFLASSHARLVEALGNLLERIDVISDWEGALACHLIQTECDTGNARAALAAAKEVQDGKQI